MKEVIVIAVMSKEWEGWWITIIHSEHKCEFDFPMADTNYGNSDKLMRSAKKLIKDVALKIHHHSREDEDLFDNDGLLMKVKIVAIDKKNCQQWITKDAEEELEKYQKDIVEKLKVLIAM